MAAFPKVTVYLTNHNYGRYIRQSVDSVLVQTFQDFELLIIDDGSTDGSVDLLKEYEGRKNTFVLFQQNKGLNATNNVALKLSRGDYLMRLDADDFLDPHALEIMVSKLDKNPDLALVFPDYYLVDEKGAVLSQMRRHDFQKEVTLLDQPAHGACTMIRKSVLLEVGGYDEAFTCQDGYDIWLKIASDHPVQNVNLPLFYYRQHDKSLTRNEERILKTRGQILGKHVQKKGMEPLRVLTVIPIRGASVDPRSLPLSPLGTHCLMDWTLEAALSSKLTGDLIVSTPDAEVQKHVRQKYAKQVHVVERNLELSRINRGVEHTILEALEHYSKNHETPDAILVLFIEAPFRTTHYIEKAIHTMQAFDVDVVDGVRPEDQIFYVHTGEGLQPWKLEEGLRLERDALYRRVGGIHLIRRDFLERERKMIGGRVGHIVLDQKAAFTIRTELDWEMARFLAQNGG